MTEEISPEVMFQELRAEYEKIWQILTRQKLCLIVGNQMDFIYSYWLWSLRAALI